MAIYFDNSATTRPFSEVADTVSCFMRDDFYNPSALYAPAVQVSHRLSLVRRQIAKEMQVPENCIFFNSGGTEGNNAIIRGVMQRRKPGVHAISSIAEHSSVFETYRALEEGGYSVDIIGVDEQGYVREEDILRAIRRDTALISIMHVNNEVGAINDVGKIAQRIHATLPQCVVHSDGVQAFPKIAFPKGVDAYTISGHKFHAPRGTGAVYIADRVNLSAAITGGGQEQGMRGGTENTPGIEGLGVALQRYRQYATGYVQRMQAVKQRLFENLSTLDGIRLNGPNIAEGAPHILNVSFAGVNSETIVHALEAKEIYVGTGSACSSRKKTRSRVLEGMRVPNEFLDGAIRFSFCYNNTEVEADIVAQEVIDAVRHSRKFRRR